MNNKEIVIVDDSKSVLELIGHTLETQGFKIHKACHGIDALKYFKGSHVDLVVTDLHMPEMNGIELIKEIRRIDQYKRIPIILLTTETQTSKKIEAKNAGATGWLVKPFNPDRLISTIRKVIR